MAHAGRYKLGCIGSALLLLFAAGAVAVPVPNDPAQLLAHAESVPPTHHAEFNDLMGGVSATAMRLSPQEEWHRRYLLARQLAFAGNYEAALAPLTAIADQRVDPVLAFRASATVIDLLVAESRYEEAFARLNSLLDQLPKMKDAEVRVQGLGVAAQLYSEAGQYDASSRYADQIVKESTDAPSACRGWFYKSDALFERGGVKLPADQLHDGTEACDKAGNTLFALSFQHLLATFEMRQGHLASALRLLQANYSKVLRAGFPPQISEFEATFAELYFKNGNFTEAREFAEKALVSNVNRQYSESTAKSYQLLYQVDKKSDDSQGALTNLEKFVDVHDGYLNRLSAKALAYQMVEQKVLAKKLLIEELNKKNGILMLQGELGRKTVETSRLYIALLLLVLVSIALWTYRIKRSQLRFMGLSRRDGLTGIFNRQHFMAEAERQLNYCEKSLRSACLVLIDLDHFKVINDTFGHAIGDRVLKRAVEACQQHLNSTDVFGRLGGEEFGILLLECTLEQAAERAEVLRIAIESVTRADSTDVQVSGSLGIAATAACGYDVRELLINADDALYQAKHAGRNRVMIFDAATTDSHSTLRKSRCGVTSMGELEG